VELHLESREAVAFAGGGLQTLPDAVAWGDRPPLLFDPTWRPTARFSGERVYAIFPTDTAPARAAEAMADLIAQVVPRMTRAAVAGGAGTRPGSEPFPMAPREAALD
jgi:hypothetical protein